MIAINIAYYKDVGCYKMTRKLEELFDLPGSEQEQAHDKIETPTKEELVAIDDQIDKINAALPQVKGLDASDSEMDDLSSKAVDSYESLMDLGMQVDSRYASEILSVASTMLGHAITAKTAKMNKKLKMVDLQLKKLKLDHDEAKANKNKDDDDAPTAEGHVLDRNELLTRILKDQNQEIK